MTYVKVYNVLYLILILHIDDNPLKYWKFRGKGIIEYFIWPPKEFVFDVKSHSVLAKQQSNHHQKN